ncbi:tail length tape measure protein [Mycobacterium phage Kimona]|uniref:Tape measure protein n=1 Tax=Mycobacterium phage Kimona TaxID=2024295 RepID=A0A249XU09_9CAUD|nr:tail length tape measure protein [Mycobacterium phage Kimona]ASZ75458.1 tape measure protein [Mycobacterium phage Kimona]
MPNFTGQEVGRISIRVVPNLDNFYRELKTKLEAIEKTLRGEVPVQVNLDPKGTRAQMAALMAGLKAQAAQGVDVPVDVNQRGLGVAWREFRAGLGDFARLGKQAAVGLRDYRREVNRLTLEQQRQRPLLNHTLAWWRSQNVMARRGKNILREFTAALRQQQVWLRQQDPTLSRNAARWKTWAMAIRDANVNATNGFRRFQAALRAMKSSGDGDGPGGFLNRFMSVFGRAGKDADKASKSFRGAGQRILGLTRVGWIFVGVFTLAAPAIALVSSLLAGLPSLLGAAGGAVGVIALGMDGIKAAAETLMPVFDQLKTAVSGTFQQALTPIFEDLATKLPQLQGGLQTMAMGLVNMFQGVTNALTSSGGMQQIQNILANTAGFFSQMQGPMQTFTQAFLTMGESGSQAFGYLAGSLGTFANQFNSMIERVSQNGVFDAAMKGLSQTLDGLTDGFTRFMEAGLNAMPQLGPALQNLLKGFTDLGVALMPALTSISSMLGNVLGQLGTSLAPIVTALTPAFTTLADTLSAVLVPNLQTLGNILTPVAELIGTTLSTAIQQVAPLLPGLVQQFAQLGATLVTNLAPHIPALATAFGQMAGAVLQLAPMLISQLVPAFIQLVPSILQLLPHVVSLAQSFARMMPTIVPLVSIIFSLIAAFAQAAATIGGVVLGAISSLIGAISNVVTKISEWVASFAQGVSDIAAKASELPGKVKSALGDLGSFLVESGRALIAGFARGIEAGIDLAVGAAKKVVSAVRNLFPFSPAKEGPFSGRGWVSYSGQSIGQAFADGMKSTQGSVVQTAKELMQAAKEVFGDAANLTFNFNFGQMASQMQSVATSAGDLQRSMSKTVKQSTGSGKLDAETRAMLDQISIRKDEIELERQKLQAEKNALDSKDKAGRAALQQRIDALNIQKDELELQREQLSYQGKYNGAVSETNSQYAELFNKMAKMPYDFATANANQFFQDLGISGEGAVSQALKEGLKFGEQFIFNVASPDDAVSMQQNIQNKKALQFNRR